MRCFGNQGAVSVVLIPVLLMCLLTQAGCGGGGESVLSGGAGATAATSLGSVGVPNTSTTAQPAVIAITPVPQVAATVDTIVGPIVAGGISAAFSASRVIGVAPLSVFFDASTTASSGTAHPFHDLEYQWNFGDSSSGTWSVGSRAGVSSRNVARGPVASHVFETPGTYTVTMGATDGSNTAGNSVQVTVQDPNVVFATNTICFSTSGAFAGCPAGAAQQTISDFGVAINTYQSTKKRLLFRRGETWSSASSARLAVTGPGVIGAFGSGSAPKWVIATGGVGLYLSDQYTAGIKDWRIMDVEMDGQDRNARGVIGDGGMNQALLLRLNIHNVTNAIVMSKDVLDYENTDGNSAHGGHTIWDQFAVVDTRVNTINGGVASGGMIGAFISAARFTFMGNDFDSAGGGEHVLRTPYVGRGVVSNNYLGRPAPTKHCWQFHAPIQGQAGVTANLYSEKVVVSDNTFYGGVSSWAVFVGPENTGLEERLRDMIFERNYFKAGAGTNVGLSMRGPISSTTIRNNIANMSASTDSYVYGFSVGDGGVGAAPTGIAFYANTIYGNSSAGMIGITIGTAPTNITVKNNLAYAPSASTTALLNGTGAYGLVTANNSSNSQIKTMSPAFASIPAQTSNTVASSDFKISASSYASGSGTAIPVVSDFFLINRTGGIADIGAVIH